MPKSENKQHPYAEILRAIADGNRIQRKISGGWIDIASNSVLENIAYKIYEPEEYRIKQIYSGN